jgi:hypothetical protein
VLWKERKKGKWIENRYNKLTVENIPNLENDTDFQV